VSYYVKYSDEKNKGCAKYVLPLSVGLTESFLKILKENSFKTFDLILSGKDVFTIPTSNHRRESLTFNVAKFVKYRWASLFVVDTSRYFGPRILNLQIKRHILTMNFESFRPMFHMVNFSIFQFHR
jgi:hypothetical protein